MVHAARAAGLSVISITDHDSTTAIDEARAAADAQGVELVPGIEISAVADGRDVHVLGYFLDHGSPRLGTFLDRQRADRLRRVAEMRDRLAELGSSIDAGPILDDASRGRSVGRPHIADALVAAGHVRTRDEAFARFLAFGGPAYVPRRGASPEEAVAIIHEAGGIASLAHPGVSPCDERIPALAAAGLDALEARHPDHDEEMERHYRELADRHGLLITGGSDFHGSEHRASALGLVTLPAADFDRLVRASGRRR